MPIQSTVVDSKIDSKSIQTILLKIKAVTKFLLFRIEYIIDWGCLFDDL